MKRVIFIANTREQLIKFPAEVRKEVGFALDRQEKGLEHKNIKPLQGFGSSKVREIRTNHDGDTYRSVFTVAIKEHIHILHVFQKKSSSGIGIPKKEIEIINKRYKKLIEEAK